MNSNLECHYDFLKLLQLTFSYIPSYLINIQKKMNSCMSKLFMLTTTKTHRFVEAQHRGNCFVK